LKLPQFIRELENQTRYLEEQSQLYTDNMLDSMKINWIGAQADCLRLVNFLVTNKYIEAPERINKYISKHFMFIEKVKSNRQLGGIDQMGGRILNMGDYLKIPKP
jgi:hypothetical protein